MIEKKCMGEASPEMIAAELDRRISEGNVKCACCLSDGTMTTEQKAALADAIIEKFKIDVKTQVWIDDHVLLVCEAKN